MKGLIRGLLPERLYGGLVYIYGNFVKFFLLLFSLIPLKNKIIVISYYGKGLGCNPKYICD